MQKRLNDDDDDDVEEEEEIEGEGNFHVNSVKAKCILINVKDFKILSEQSVANLITNL